MKKIIQLLGIVMLLSIVSYGCKKDDTDDSTTKEDDNQAVQPKSFFEFKGKKYEIVKCFYKHVYSSNTQNYQINLVPKAITYNSYVQHLMGSGDGLRIDISLSLGSPFPNSGSFVIDTTNNYAEPGEVWASNILLNHDYSLDEGIAIHLDTGRINIFPDVIDTFKIVGSFMSDSGVVIINFRGSKQRYNDK